MAQPRRSRTTIVVGGVPEHFNLPWKLAIETGAFADAGLDVAWVDEPAGTGAINAALRDRRFDMATVLTEGLIAARDNGLRAPIEGIYVNSPLWWGIHVPLAQREIPVASLPHRRIAISRLGSGSHLMAFVLAAAQNWTLTADSFITVGGLTGGVDALANGDADVFLWETFMTKPAVDAGRIARAGEIPTPWPSFVLARRAGFAHEQAAKVIAVIGRSVDAFVSDPHTPALIATRLGINEADARTWLARTEYACGAPLRRNIVASVRSQLRATGATA